MKFYGVRRQKLNEDVNYLIARIGTLIKSFMVFDKDKRKQRKLWYKQLFKDKCSIGKYTSFSIPKGKYYIPISIVATDLVAKENISVLKKGVKKLLLKYTSHKFFGRQPSISEIFETIDEMDDTFTSWSTFVDCGRFDFSRNKKLSQYIDYFDIYIKNFNTSYLAVEIHIYLAEDIKNKLIEIINNDYKHERGFAINCFSHNSKKSGGKKSVSIAHYNDADLKSETINNMMIEIKWYLFNEISKYLPIILHKRNIMPPSVNLYKTNILYNDNSARVFWRSVGVSSFRGQFLSCSEKLFFETTISSKSTHGKTDMIFIVNDETHQEQDGYYNFDFQVMIEFLEEYNQLYKLYLAYILNDVFAASCVKYRNKINKIKLKKNSFNKLLKIRYSFEKDMDWFKRFANETNWKKEQQRVEKIFDKKQCKRSYDYRVLTESPLIGQKKIKNSLDNIEKDIDQKLSIIEHINDYYRERKNSRINIVMLAISLTTLLFIIYPQWASKVAVVIGRIISWIFNYFALKIF